MAEAAQEPIPITTARALKITQIVNDDDYAYNNWSRVMSTLLNRADQFFIKHLLKSPTTTDEAILQTLCSWSSASPNEATLENLINKLRDLKMRNLADTLTTKKDEIRTLIPVPIIFPFDDFRVTADQIPDFVDKIAADGQALQKWNIIKYHLVSEAEDIHQVNALLQDQKPLEAVQKTMNTWHSRADSIMFHTLLRVLMEYWLKRLADQLIELVTAQGVLQVVQPQQPVQGARAEEDPDSVICVICNDNRVNRVFRCGHPICSSCLERIPPNENGDVLCHICRDPITTTNLLFI